MSLINLLFPKLHKFIYSAVLNVILRTKYRRDIRLEGFLWIDGRLKLRINSSLRPSVHIGRECRLLGDVELRTRDSSSLKLGNGIYLDGPLRIVAAGKGSQIKIGDGCRFTPYSIINGGGNIEFGEMSLFGPRFTLNANEHIFQSDKPVVSSGFKYVDVSIGRNVWIGADVSVLPGARIESDAVIGANSVVNSIIKSREVFAGSPARKIGKI